MKKEIVTPRGTFAYRSYGSVGNPTLILVHGWPQNSYCWNEIAQHLTPYHIIAPDLRGLGDSERTLAIDAYSKDQLGLDIFAIAAALNIDEFNLGGHDWGSAVVQEMALMQPKPILKLILINMMIINHGSGKKKAAQTLGKNMFRSSWYQFFQNIPKFPEELLEGKEEVWVRFFCKGIKKDIPEEALLEYIRCYKKPFTITTGANFYRSMPIDRARWSNYSNKKIEVPSHIIHGELDRVVIPEFLEEVETAFLYPVNITYLDGGHFICDEQPQAVAEAIGAFLKKQ